MNHAETARRRIEWIDLARGLALVAMAVYHFAWDLEFFGYAPAGMTAVGGWKLFARGIASSFLFLVGVSLVLSHARGVHWPPFFRRLLMIVAAAAAVTLATYFATPDAFIFFGILHQIAFASVAGLLFLRLPPALTLAAAALVIAAPHVIATGLFDAPWLLWLGLATERPRSSDFVPVFPWFGAVLIGIAAARFGMRLGLFDRLRSMSPGGWSRPLQFAGRHSLAVYLIHQPVLIGSLWLFSQLFPAPMETRDTRFRQACETSCSEQQPAQFCTAYCGCMLDALEANDMLDTVFSGTPSDAFRARLQDEAALCTASTQERLQSGGGND